MYYYTSQRDTYLRIGRYEFNHLVGIVLHAFDKGGIVRRSHIGAGRVAPFFGGHQTARQVDFLRASGTFPRTIARAPFEDSLTRQPRQRLVQLVGVEWREDTGFHARIRTPLHATPRHDPPSFAAMQRLNPKDNYVDLDILE